MPNGERERGQHPVGTERMGGAYDSGSSRSVAGAFATVRQAIAGLSAWLDSRSGLADGGELAESREGK